MNEKIKELIFQAGSFQDPEEGIPVFNKEKFAKLIIQECAKVVEDVKEQGVICRGAHLVSHFEVE